MPAAIAGDMRSVLWTFRAISESFGGAGFPALRSADLPFFLGLVVLDLARGYPADHDGGADHVGGALLTSGASGHGNLQKPEHDEGDDRKHNDGGCEHFDGVRAEFGHQAQYAPSRSIRLRPKNSN
jgi:hypothetical protein